MPDSYGKRQRRQVKAKKTAAREERRIARNQRRADRAAGTLEDPDLGPPLDAPRPVDTDEREERAEEPDGQSDREGA
jgi:hypothetical protein